MADLPLATDEIRRRLTLPPDRQYGIDPGEGNTRGYAFNQWLPVSTNKVGSGSWVQQGNDPQWAVPQALQGGLLGVAGMADAPRTGKLTPEALTSLLGASTVGGGLLAPEGALAMGGARSVVPKSLADVTAGWEAAGIDHAVSEGKGGITLSKIVVPKENRGQGLGTSAMQALIDYADTSGQRIVLSPSSDFGGNKSRLVDFYKRQGFIENKGRNKDFSTRETMIRDPGVPMKERVY